MKVLLVNSGMTILEDVNKIKLELGPGKHTPLIDSYTEIGKFIQIIYRKSPFIEDFLEFINEKERSILTIINNIKNESPNMILNFLAKKQTRGDLMIKIQNSEIRDEKFASIFIKDYMNKSIIGAFKRHLQHVGLVKQSTVYSGIWDEYDPRNDKWAKKFGV